MDEQSSVLAYAVGRFTLRGGGARAKVSLPAASAHSLPLRAAPRLADAWQEV